MMSLWKCHRILPILLLIGCSMVFSNSLAEVRQMSVSECDDLGAIIQLILDHPQLQQYFHQELPGRQPLRILETEALAGRPPLAKFGAPVEYIEQAPKGDGAYIEFRKIDLKDDQAQVEFIYPIEGVIGKVELNKQNGEWAIRDISITEE